MTYIGVFTDIHANLPALEAILAELDREGCEMIVHTGDFIGIGPHPAEVLECLLAQSNVHLLMGNHDALFAQGLPRSRPTGMDQGEYEHQQWTHARIPPSLQEAVATWPYLLDANAGTCRVRFCHYPLTPDGTEFLPIQRSPTPDDLDNLFADCTADVIFYGHHHPLSDLQGRVRYINPGAAGCSPDNLARFALIDAGEDSDVNVRFSSVPYDRESVLTDFDRRAVPARDQIRRIFFGQPA